MSSRRLVSLRRLVPAEQRAAYDAAWEEVRRCAVGQGAHAWRFASVSEAGVFLEFLEFAAESDPRLHADVLAALLHLDQATGRASCEEWLELQ